MDECLHSPYPTTLPVCLTMVTVSLRILRATQPSPPIGWLTDPAAVGPQLSGTLSGYLLSVQHNFFSLFWQGDAPASAVGVLPVQPWVNLSASAPVANTTFPGTGTHTQRQRQGERTCVCVSVYVCVWVLQRERVAERDWAVCMRECVCWPPMPLARSGEEIEIERVDGRELCLCVLVPT
jgi:hypothetical protein